VSTVEGTGIDDHIYGNDVIALVALAWDWPGSQLASQVKCSLS